MQGSGLLSPKLLSDKLLWSRPAVPPSSILERDAASLTMDLGESQKKSSVALAARISSAVCEAHASRGGVETPSRDIPSRMELGLFPSPGLEQSDELGDGSDETAELEMRFEDSAESDMWMGSRVGVAESSSLLERLVIKLAGDTVTGILATLAFCFLV